MSRTLPLALSAASGAVSAVARPAAGQTWSEQRRFDAAQCRYDQETAIYIRERAMYDAARRRDTRRSGYNDQRYNDPRYDDPNYDSRYATDYAASRYYRDDPRYQERVLTDSDQVYRGSDGRYYCKRNDGTTGLIVGGAGCALVGNVLAGGRHRVAGTLRGR